TAPSSAIPSLFPYTTLCRSHQHLAQAPLARPTIRAYADQIHGHAGFHAGLGQQGVDEFVPGNATGLGLEHQAHRGIFARFVPDGDRKSTRLNSSHVKNSYAV